MGGVSRDERASASALLGRAIVWDNHGCMPLRADDSFLPQLERYRAAGFNVVSLNVGFGAMSCVEHLDLLSFMRQWLGLRPETYRLIRTVEDIRRAKSEGQLGIVFDVEGMVPVQRDPKLVQTFYERGVRWMLIAYNRGNAAGSGCLDGEDGGLSTVGRAIIDEMERVGMVLCLSHAGLRTARQAMEYSRNPVIYSHSNPASHHAHPRNVADDLIVECAKRGGVFGLSGIGSFLGGNDHVVQRLLSQIKHVIDLVGPSHVGLGLDYVFDLSELEALLRQNPGLFAPGSSITSRGAVAPEALLAIVEGLARDNLTDAEIGGILGGNWLRIAAAVWR